MENQYDVMVIGGGTAGTVAAIQAGRAGARTLLLEKNGTLGGTLTVAGVNFPSLFFAWGRQVIAGVGWELVVRTARQTGGHLPDLDDPNDPRWRHGITVNKCVFAALADEMVLDAGAELLLHAMPASVEFRDGRWRVGVCTKTGLRPVTAKVLIDATADANAVTLAGLEVDRPQTVQPGTLMMNYSGYDLDAVDLDAVDAAFARAVGDGRIRHTDVGWRKEGPRPFLRSGGGNCNHVTVRAAETSEGRTAAEVDARRAMMRVLRFFRSQPGLEGFRMDWIAPECGVRETVVIRGKKRLTCDDYMSGRLFDDAVCYCFYGIDIHLDDGQGIDGRPLPKGVVPTIPRGAMLPAGSRFLIVAGRCIAGDREAHSAYRVEAPCMAMGQAAAAMAALSARTGTDPEHLPMPEVRALLRAHGAIVPPDEPAP